jgi:hypothetical protein
MNVKEDFFNMGNFNINDGRQVRFWKDAWLGTAPLKQQYLNLYNIVRRRNATVADIFNSRPLNVSFQNLIAENLLSWHDLVRRLIDIHLTDRPDTFKWSLNHNGQFSVKSMYQAFLDTHVALNNSYLWKNKIPLKNRVFMWLLYREAILTKDNLVKRNWQEMLCVVFVITLRPYNIYFFDCVLAKFLWRVIQLTFGLTKPHNIKHVYGGWV